MTIKIDKNVKNKAQKIAKDLGFPLGTLVNAFFRQFIRNKTIYFTTINATIMSKEMEKQLSAIERDIQHETNLSPAFNSMHDLVAHMKKP